MKLLSLSYSGAETLNTCERKFCYKYLARLDIDADYVKKDYFSIGNAFHKVLELTGHDPAKFSQINFQGIVKSYNLDPHEDGGRIAAMLRRYWVLHKAIPLAVVGTETKFEGTYTNGVIDATMVESGGLTDEEANRMGLANVKGAWWIVDLKTAGKEDSSLPSRLQNDPQLNLYAAFRNVVAEKFNLDSNLFAGVRYRESFKPGQKVKAGESFSDWTTRCSAGTSCREIVIPASRMDLKYSFDNFHKSVARAHELQQEFINEKRFVGRCNFKNCLAYGSPCEWYSKCYGRSYTEAQHTTLINSVGVDDQLVSLGKLFSDVEAAQDVAQDPMADLLNEFSQPPNPDDFV